MRIAEYLNFDVTGARDVALDEQASVAEIRAGEPYGRFCRRHDLARLPHHSHALATAAGDGLQDDRQTDLGRQFLDFERVVARPLSPGKNRHSGFCHGSLGEYLVAQTRY